MNKEFECESGQEDLKSWGFIIGRVSQSAVLFAIAISIVTLILLNFQTSLGMLNQIALVTHSGVGTVPIVFHIYLLAPSALRGCPGS